jgi:hypothetical protein
LIEPARRCSIRVGRNPRAVQLPDDNPGPARLIFPLIRFTVARQVHANIAWLPGLITVGLDEFSEQVGLTFDDLDQQAVGLVR